MAKQESLIPDAAIPELENLAEKYADVRDKRQVLTTREAALKADLLATMKRLRKMRYEHDGIEIERVIEEETVKVKFHKVKEEEDGAPSGKKTKPPKAKSGKDAAAGKDGEE